MLCVVVRGPSFVVCRLSAIVGCHGPASFARGRWSCVVVVAAVIVAVAVAVTVVVVVAIISVAATTLPPPPL